MKTIFIQNGSCVKGLKLIRKLLAENDYERNIIASRVICADTQDNIGKLQEFLSCPDFVFVPMSKGKPLDLKQNIDEVVLCQEDDVFLITRGLLPTE